MHRHFGLHKPPSCSTDIDQLWDERAGVTTISPKEVCAFLVSIALMANGIVSRKPVWFGISPDSLTTCCLRYAMRTKLFRMCVRPHDEVFSPDDDDDLLTYLVCPGKGAGGDHNTALISGQAAWEHCLTSGTPHVRPVAGCLSCLAL